MSNHLLTTPTMLASSTEDTTFKEVLDETRRELSLSYIKEKHTPIKEITYLLGYSDPANFSRAFKRWTSMSPSAGHKASG